MILFVALVLFELADGRRSIMFRISQAPLLKHNIIIRGIPRSSLSSFAFFLCFPDTRAFDSASDSRFFLLLGLFRLLSIITERAIVYISFR